MESVYSAVRSKPLYNTGTSRPYGVNKHLAYIRNSDRYGGYGNGLKILQTFIFAVGFIS